MALEFTSIPDRNGPAIYLLGDGSTQTKMTLVELGDQIDQATPDETQVVYLDPNSGDGLSVKEFYAIETLPCTMIIMDDDTMPYQWHGLPRPDEITYALSQITG